VPTAGAITIVPTNFEDETRRLELAVDALASDPSHALSLCNDDAIIFPDSPLGQEREAIAIDALTRLGKMNDAKARAKKFAVDYPGSIHLSRVRRLVGDPL
jgi:hypothetical protein